MARNITNYPLGSYAPIVADATLIRKSHMDEIRQNIGVVHSLGDNLDLRTNSIETVHVASGITKTARNLGRGGYAGASSYVGTAVPKKAFDEKTTTYWATTAMGNSVIGEYIVCAFGPHDGVSTLTPVFYTVSQIKFSNRVVGGENTFCTAGVTNLVVEVMTDSAWVNAPYTVSGTSIAAAAILDSTEVTLNITTPVSAKKIRLRATAGTGVIAGQSDNTKNHWAMYSVKLLTGDTVPDVEAKEAETHSLTTYNKSGLFDFLDKIKLDSMTDPAVPAVSMMKNIPADYCPAAPEWWKFAPNSVYSTVGGNSTYRFVWNIPQALIDANGPLKIIDVQNTKAVFYLSSHYSGYGAYDPLAIRVYFVENGVWSPFDSVQASNIKNVSSVGLEIVWSGAVYSHPLYGVLYNGTDGTLPSGYTDYPAGHYTTVGYGKLQTSVVLRTIDQ